MSSEDVKAKDPEKAFDDGSSASVHSVSAQIAKEDGHAIQYRTCSWQKVCVYILRCRGLKLILFCADDRIADV
jgi:hypothetical protein